MISKIKANEEPQKLLSFLPSNLLYDLDESINISNISSHLDSNVSNYSC